MRRYKIELDLLVEDDETKAIAAARKLCKVGKGPDGTVITREEQVENADDAVDAIIELNPLWDKAGLDLQSYSIKYVGQISVDELLEETTMDPNDLIPTTSEFSSHSS